MVTPFALFEATDMHTRTLEVSTSVVPKYLLEYADDKACALLSESETRSTCLFLIIKVGGMPGFAGTRWLHGTL